MASSVVKVTLLSDAQRFKAGFKEAEQATGSFDTKVSSTASLVKGALAGAAAAAVKAFVDDSVRAFSELEQSVGGTEAVFGSASGSIDSFAKKSAQAIGLSESEFRNATTSIGGQLKRMTGDVDLAADRSVVLTEVAADLAATYGGTTAEAVQALGAAFRGEADPAERFNLNLKASVVNAKAVELGLAASTTEVSESAKAQAILALITEQSADAQGQFAREADSVAGAAQRSAAQLENNKAVVGEAFAGAYRVATPLVADLSGVLADLAINLSLAIDAMTEAEAALARFQQKHGRTIETLDDLVAGVNDGTIGWAAFGKILDEIDLPTDEIITWRQELDGAAHSAGLNTTSTDLLREAMDAYIVTQEQAGRDAARHRGNFRELGSGIKEVEDSADEATTALQRFEDEVRSQTEPLYALQQAEQAVAEAKQAVTAAEEEFTTDSPEYRAALIELARKSEELTAAQIKVGEQSGFTAETYRAHLQSMGRFTAEQIEIIMAEFARVNAFQFANKWINVGARITGDLTGGKGIAGRQRHGGPVRKGEAYIVGEGGEEVFVPDEDGEIIPNDRIGRGGTPIGPTAAEPPIVINIHNAGSVVTARDLVDEIHEGLLRKQRRTGRLGLQ